MQVGAGGYTGAEFISYGARQLQNRTALGGGAQITFISNAFLVEGEHVCHNGPGIEQRDGRIIQRTGGQRCQRAYRFALIVRQRCGANLIQQPLQE